MDLTRLRRLSVAEARRYVAGFEPRLSAPDPRIGMDLDPAALCGGSSAHPGALLVAGGRTGTLRTPPADAATVFVEGDLHVEGCLVNRGHLLITGDLVARAVCTQQYLVVLGDLRVERFLGVEEHFGTRVLGDLYARDVVSFANHHLSLFGTLHCTTYVDDEDDGRDAAAEVFRRWGVPPGERYGLDPVLRVLT